MESKRLLLSRTSAGGSFWYRRKPSLADTVLHIRDSHFHEHMCYSCGQDVANDRYSAVVD